MFRRGFVFIGVFLLASVSSVAILSLSGCGGSSPSPSVAVTAAASTVDGTDATTLTATVTNDQNAAGVTWTMSGAGTLSNQTTTSATFTAPAATGSAQSATITATSVADPTATPGTATITIPAAPAITSLTGAQQGVAVGTSYSVTLAGTGGISPYTNWALAGGSAPLPACLKLSSAGVLTSTGSQTVNGAPAAGCVGVYSGIIFTMTDSGTATALTATSSAQTITVTGPTLTFPTSLPNAAVGSAYSQSAAASGALGTTTYSLASGALPASGHLALNTSTGAITGTPYAADAGTYHFTVSVIDQYGDTATSSNFTLTVTAPTLTFATPTATATAGAAYASSATASGAVGTTTYSLASGALPASGHLALNTSTGAITGTPYAADAGTYHFTVRVTDQYGDTATSSNFTLTITAPTLTFATPTAIATVGTAYSSSAAASGTVGTTTYTLASGALPASGHLTLNTSTGAITGTPYAADDGAYTFAVKVTDQYGDTATSNNFSITISSPAITFATPAATATVGTAYSSSAAASGAVGTTTYTLASGALPASGHLALNTSTGAITGTPYAADDGTYHFTVSVTDQYGDTATSGNFSITISSPSITFATPTATATAGAAYSSSAAASGTVGTTTYSLASGSLPSSGDLVLNTSTGAITGTPYAADNGTYTFTVSVTDQYGDTATSGSLNIVISSPTITFTTPAATATVGSAYSSSAAASGTVGTTTYSLASGSLPASGDLVLNSSTGAIAGTPKAADVGTYTFKVKVTDHYGNTATSGSLSITVNPAGVISFGAAPTATATAGVAYSSALSASGGSGSLTYSITVGSLPIGLSLNASTGAITGTPTGTAQPYNFTAQAADNFGDSATQGYTITVNPGAAARFTVAASSPQSAGTAFNFTVTAYDQYGNTATGYAGTAKFTSSDGKAVMPSPGTLTSGVGAFPATLETAGSQTIIATDTVNSSITGTTGTITVNPGAYTKLLVSAPSAATTNAQISVTVTAQDAYGNTETGNSDSIAFSSTDSAALLPSPSNLSNGTGSFNATFKTQGNQTITATDTTVSPHVVGTSGNITVSTLLIIATGSLNPLDVGQAATQQLAATGGSGNSANYSWSWTAQAGSSIPPGLSLSTGGAMSGTATTPGAYNVTVKVVDNSVSPSQNYSTNFTMTVNSALSLPTPDPASLPSTAYAGYAYNNGNGGTITGTGGSSNLSIAVSGAGLPADGLSALSSGATLTVSGTPVTFSPAPPYTVSFNVQLTDTTTGYSITTNGYNINVVAPTNPTLPAASSTVPGGAIENVAYNSSISLTGGVGPTYTWTLNGATTIPTSGSVALGSSGLAGQFNISNSGGGSSVSITGTPTSTGTVSFSLYVKDNTTGLTSSTVEYTLTVNPVSTIVIAVEKVPQGMVNMPYTFGNDLSITGGTGPYTCAYTNAPAGLALQSGTCNLVGTPTSSGSPTVTLKVTDTTTPVAQTQTTTFTLPVVPETVAVATNTGYLKGQYACSLEQFWDTGSTSSSGSGNLLYRGGGVLAFTANGSGAITGGEADHNSPHSGYQYVSSLSGAYAVGSDNRGYLNLTTVNTIFAIAGGNLNTSGVFSEFAITEMDDAGANPSGTHGGGHCYLQSPASSWNTANAALSGSYAFGFRDESPDGSLGALAGYVDFTSASSSVSGEVDQVKAGTFNGPASLTGTYTKTVDSYGRTTMTIGPSQGQSPFVVYLTNNSAGEMLVMTTASHGNGTQTGANDLFIGEARAQNASAVSSSTPLSGPFVLYMSGPDCCGNFKASVIQMAAHDYVDLENDNSSFTASSGSGAIPYTYPAASITSRGTFNTSPGYGADLFYVYNTNSAVVLFADGQSSGEAQGLLGWIEPQTAPTGSWALSDMSSASGTSYLMGSLQNWNNDLDSQSGTMTVTSASGAMSPFAQDEGDQNFASWGENFSLILNTPATGSIALDPTYGQDGVFDVNITPTGGTAITVSNCVAISVDEATNSSTKGRFACVNTSDGGGPVITIGQQ